MPDDKPLPNPHKRPWEESDSDESLLADRMARAMAEGRLEEFVAEEFEGNENAQRLAEFMMQMTGMGPMPASGAQAGGTEKARQEEQPLKEDADDMEQDAGPAPEPAAQAADSPAEASGEQPAAESGPSTRIPEALSRIAAENDVEVEWLISRALSLYIRDYRATGRL